MALELIHRYTLPGDMFAVAEVITAGREWLITDVVRDVVVELALIGLKVYNPPEARDIILVQGRVTFQKQTAWAGRIAVITLLEEPWPTRQTRAIFELETDPGEWLASTDLLRRMTMRDPSSMAIYARLGQQAVRAWWYQRLPEWGAALAEKTTPAASGEAPEQPPGGRPGGKNAERDRDIYAHFTGAKEPQMSKRQLAETYNLGQDRIKQIIRAERGKENRGVDKGGS